MAAMMSRSAPIGLRASPLQAQRSSRTVVCCAQTKGEQASLAMLAGLVATSLLTGAIVDTPEAMAAKSGGRVGGGGGFRSARSAPAPARNTQTRVVNNTVVVAPPVMAPSLFGFGGFGFHPFGMGYGYGMPMGVGFGFGGIFQLFALLMVVSVVFSVIRNLTSSGDNKNKKKDDDGWGDL